MTEHEYADSLTLNRDIVLVRLLIKFRLFDKPNQGR